MIIHSQIKFTFRSDPMIVGRVMALGLWNLAKYLVVTTFFAMLWDIDLIFGMWVYSDKLQIEFTFRSGPMIFGRVMALRLWNLAKYLVKKVVTTKYLAKFQSPRAITRPNIIGSERNVNLICNSLLYTHIQKNQVNISFSHFKVWGLPRTLKCENLTIEIWEIIVINGK
jgi:hypothetical protein